MNLVQTSKPVSFDITSIFDEYEIEIRELETVIVDGTSVAYDYGSQLINN